MTYESFDYYTLYNLDKLTCATSNFNMLDIISVIQSTSTDIIYMAKFNNLEK